MTINLIVGPLSGPARLQIHEENGGLGSDLRAFQVGIRTVSAFNETNEQFVVFPHRTQTIIKVDGIPTVEEWANVPRTLGKITYVPDRQLGFNQTLFDSYKGKTFGELRIQYDPKTLYLLAEWFDDKPNFRDEFGVGILNNATKHSPSLNDYAFYFRLDNNLQLFKTSGDFPNPPYWNEIEGAYTCSPSFTHNTPHMIFEVGIPLKTLSAGLKEDPTMVELKADCQTFTDRSKSLERFELDWPHNIAETNKNALLVFPGPIPEFSLLSLSRLAIVTLIAAGAILSHRMHLRRRHGK